MTNNVYEPMDPGMLLVTFFLGEAVFGIDIGQVQEVMRVGKITPVHHASSYVVGICNLRGRIVTVIDMRLLLELARVDYGPESRIIIVEWQGELIGLMVDLIADTVAVDSASIELPPSNMNGVGSYNLHGVCRGSEWLVAVLNLDAVLASGDRPSPAPTRKSEILCA